MTGIPHSFILTKSFLFIRRNPVSSVPSIITVIRLRIYFPANLSRINYVFYTFSRFTYCIVPSRSLPYMAQLVSNECLTATGHFQDVRLITFDIASSGMK